jgi:hypothetical protein
MVHKLRNSRGIKELPKAPRAEIISRSRGAFTGANKKRVEAIAKHQIRHACLVCGKPPWWHLQRVEAREDNGHDFV